MDVEPARVPTRAEVIGYYSDDRVAAAIASFAKSREIAGVFPDGRYDARPNVAQYADDIKRMAGRGITSFHVSVERWVNPMALSTEPEVYRKLRTGWDFVLDIDAKTGLDDARETARMIVRMLGSYGIEPAVKFSGRRGFHVMVPWECFPAELNYEPLAAQYPDVPRVLARFVRKEIEAELLDHLRGQGHETENPFQAIEVEKDWGNRHMFRSPFSLNEKTWLVSVPVMNLATFTPEGATMAAAKEIQPFRAAKAQPHAQRLLAAAMAWYATVKPPERPNRTMTRPERKMAEADFPPCMRLVLGGLDDGKKRSIFTLINFLRMMNWTDEEIEARVRVWNAANPRPLPAAVVESQLRYHLRRAPVPPANCDVEMYYRAIGICQPDGICMRGAKVITIKNPINYPYRKLAERRTGTTKWRGYTCGACGKELKSERALAQHKGREHEMTE